MAETTNRRRWLTGDILRPMNLRRFAGDGACAQAVSIPASASNAASMRGSAASLKT